MLLSFQSAKVKVEREANDVNSPTFDVEQYARFWLSGPEASKVSLRALFSLRRKSSRRERDTELSSRRIAHIYGDRNYLQRGRVRVAASGAAQKEACSWFTASRFAHQQAAFLPVGLNSRRLPLAKRLQTHPLSAPLAAATPEKSARGVRRREFALHSMWERTQCHFLRQLAWWSSYGARI